MTDLGQVGDGPAALCAMRCWNDFGERTGRIAYRFPRACTGQADVPKSAALYKPFAAAAQVDAGIDVAVAGYNSSVALRRERRISQPTPRKSAMPTMARPKLVYLELPLPRARWLTGTLVTCQPARCIKAGR